MLVSHTLWSWAKTALIISILLVIQLDEVKFCVLVHEFKRKICIPQKIQPKNLVFGQVVQRSLCCFCIFHRGTPNCS